ncbi:LUD domain-containing protein [Candidatus Parcubacteria bacterium]|nr:LUD domain-containing protein [Candidatus Parcubacteria bacterium]
MDYTQPASQDITARTAAALTANGIEAHTVENAAQAKAKLFEMIPAGAEVMTMTSVTLDAVGADKEFFESGRYDSIRKRFAALDPQTQGAEMRKLAAAPQWTVGSVHAVTEDGHVMIASASGSQLPAYAYGAANVVWIAGTNKIVKDTAAGLKRIYEYALPLESERARRAYGVAGSSVNKLLIINREGQAGRARIILVNEALGF